MYHRLSFFLAAGKPAPGGGSNVYLDPTSNLPGTTGLENLINGVGYWALIAAMLGVIVGAVFWAFGHFSQNYGRPQMPIGRCR